MSDVPSMSGVVSHSTSQSAKHVIEQRNLLGGSDLVPILKAGKGKKARQFHIASEGRVGFAVALALVVEHGRQKAKETGVTSMTRCPRCNHEGPTAQDFGYRIIRGERRPQSWCRGCRSQGVTVPTTAPVPLKWSTGSSAGNAASEGSADGWLFPPETLRAKPRKAKKRQG
ncbi:hypothetical protein POL68_28715 [Stigmatella sp. ncwal1]|uniref:Uncharacterized protein n=1 Tax=Stigmatella ashevillensis TaxID=2995309 RepID=A0ABT5DHC2_9BACT|nr:hypothetical protein [Stigmatella ashevillena]MDC0712479.1 hypothetical protein [Stigmatella ashevillena]